VLADLPGVKSEDVNVELSDQTVTISGTRVPYEEGQAQQLERPFGAFSRSSCSCPASTRRASPPSTRMES